MTKKILAALLAALMALSLTACDKDSGNDGGEIVVGVLSALPVGDIRLHAQQTVFHFLHRFIGGHGYYSFLAGAVKVVKDAQPVRSGQFHALGAEGGKVGDQVSAHTGKIT